MDAQATFSCSLAQSDLGPIVELPSLPHWPAQRLLPGPNPTLILVANSSESSESKVSPFADAPILTRFRPSLDFHGRVFRLSIGPGSIGNPLFQRLCRKSGVEFAGNPGRVDLGGCPPKSPIRPT